MSDAEALLLDRSLRFSPQESAMEQGWLLSEMYLLNDWGNINKSL